MVVRFGLDDIVHTLVYLCPLLRRVERGKEARILAFLRIEYSLQVN